MVFAFELMLFLFLAKQTLDSERHAFGGDFSHGTTISLRPLVRAAKRVSWRPELCGFPQPLTSATLSIRKSLISSCLDTHQIGRKLQAFLVLVKKLIVD
jgi:hypothetical protein